MIVEGNFTFETPGARWRGAIDGLGAFNDRALLEDTKTTSSPVWAMDANDLLTDVQRNTYAWHVMQKYEVNEIDTQWTYGLTNFSPDAPKAQYATPDQVRKWKAWVAAKKPLAWAVRGTAEYGQVKVQVEKIDALAQELYQIRAKRPDPSKVRGVAASCPKYEGCPYANTAHCSLTTADIYGRDDQNMGIMNLVKDQKVKQAELAASAGMPPPVTEDEAPPPPPAADAWAPGDPLCDAQRYLIGKPLFVVAMAAEVPPEQDVAMAWPGAMQAYKYDPESELTQEIPPAVKARLLASAQAAVKDTAKEAGYPVQKDPINAPEKPAFAAPSPEVAEAQHKARQELVGQIPKCADDDKTEGGTFEALKAECARLGLNPEGKKLRTAGYRNLLSAYWANAPRTGQATAAVSEPPPPPPPAEDEVPAPATPELSASDELLANRVADILITRVLAYAQKAGLV
jgi:hypothetical protein